MDSKQKSDLIMLIILIIWLFIFLMISVYSIDIPSGSCQNFNLFNGTDNTSYIQNICSPTCSKCFLNMIFTDNQTYSNSSDNCNVNLAVAVQKSFPVYQNITNVTYNDTCSFNYTFTTFNTTFTNKTGSCNVEIKNPMGYCPPCLSPTGKCTLRDMVNPKRGNVTIYNYTDDSCDVGITINECSIHEFYPPEDYMYVSKDFVGNLTNIAQVGQECCDKLSRETALSISLQEKYENTTKSTCSVPDKYLYECSKKFGSHEKKYLEAFAVFTDVVNEYTLVDYVYPELTGEQKSYEEYYARSYLQDFAKCQMAEAICTGYQSSRYGNETICTYKPIINQFCIDRMKDLTAIEKIGYGSGIKHTLTGVGFLVIVFLSAMMIAASLPPIPIF